MGNTAIGIHGVRDWFGRHPSVSAILGLFVIGVMFFHQPLFSGGLVNATDILTQQYFWNSFIKENLFADPCFQTWLPYVNAGTPFSGGLDLIFRPGMLLTLLLLPVHLALNYEMVIYFFLMGVGMYFYMRELRVRPLTAFFAALCLMLNGEIVTLLNAGHVNKIGAIAPVTFVFWGLERALQRNTLRAYIWAGVALGVQFWQGHVQISFYTCLAVWFYWIVRMIVLAVRAKAVRVVVFLLLSVISFLPLIAVLAMRAKAIRPIKRAIIYAAVMVMVFLLLSAVNFLPLIAFAQVSDRAEGVSYEFAASWSMPPEELILYLIPNFFGLRRANYFEDEADVQQVEYWGRMPFTQTGRYFGLLPLFFLLLAVCLVRNRHVLTLGIVAVIILLLGMGQYIPTYKLLYTYVPGFNMFRAPQMILFLFAFATSALAGFGAEWFFFDVSEQKNRPLRVFLLIGIGIALCAWLVTFLLPQLEPTLLTRFHDALLRNNAAPELARLRLKNIVRGGLQFDLLFSITLFVIGLRLAPQIRLRWIVSAVLLVYLLDIGLFNEKYIDTIPMQRSFYVAENDAIRYFKAHPGYYRILQIANTPETYNVSNKYVIHHLCNVSGYEAVGVQYYNEYLENMALGSPMLDLLNIKYLIFPKGTQFGEQPAQVGQTVGPYKVVLDADALVLENLNVLPRVYPVHQAYVIPKAEERLGALNDPQFNPQEVVILEDVPPVAMAPTDLPSSQSRAEITHYLNRTIQINVSMATDGFLVLSEKYYRGWKAYIDGQPTRIYRANHTLQTIIVPQGEHQVTFAFQPTQFLLGFSLTLLTGIVLLGIWYYARTPHHPQFARLHQRAALFLKKARVWYVSPYLLWGLVGVGILLHTTQYLFNRSLNVDEAGVAVAIRDQSYATLLPPFAPNEPAGYQHTTPPLFLLSIKFLVTLLGDSEYVFRLIPFLSGVLAIVLFLYVIRTMLPPFAVPVTLAMFVVSDQLIYWSSALRQYASDVFIALLLYAVMLTLLKRGFTLVHSLLFGLIGATMVWLSHPAALVLAGIGTPLIVTAFFKKDWRRCLLLLLAIAIWLTSFAVLYWLSYRDVTDKAPLQQFWGGAFFNFPPSSVGATIKGPLIFSMDFAGYALGLSQAIYNRIVSHSIFRLLATVRDLLAASDESFGLTMKLLLFGAAWTYLYALATTFAVVGGVALYRQSRLYFFGLIAPLGFAYLACAMHKFPFAQRILLFFVPATLILIGAGMHVLKAKAGTLIAGLLISSLLAYPIGAAWYYGVHPRVDQEIKPVLQYLQEYRQADDTIYVYYAAQPAFTYYARRFGLTEGKAMIGIASREDVQRYQTDLDQLRGKPRVWLVFSHVMGNEDQYFLQYLEHLGGKRLDAFIGLKAAVYLYALNLGGQ